jgi:hypothetical protein
MDKVMSPREFKYGLLKLADDGPELINERVIARHLAAAYIDAGEAAQRDCSAMLRRDLEEQTHESD